MADNFDPDAYLASKSKNDSFDPDAYLSAKAPKADKGPGAFDIGEQLDKHALNPKNLLTALQAQRDNIPIFSSLATKGAAALEAGIQAPFSDKDFGQIYDENMAMDAKDRAARGKEAPIADTLGGLSGAAYLPNIGSAVKGIPGVATRIGANMGMSGADTLARTGDLDEAKHAAKTGGIISAGVEAIPVIGKGLGALGKKVGSAAFDVGEGATERYLANPEAVRGAKDFKGVTDDFLEHVDSTRSGLGADSKIGFSILEKSGKSAPAKVFADPVNAEIARLDNGGTFSKEARRTVDTLSELKDSIESIAAKSDGQIPLEKGKSLVMQIDDMISKAKSTNAGKQELIALANIRQQADRVLKAASPEYEAHMAQLAGDTDAAKGIADKFRSENGAQNLLKRVARGKDEYSADALKNYDDRFGKNFSDDLQNSYAKDAFDGGHTNGARKAVAGYAIGQAAGSMIPIPGAGPVLGAAGAGTGLVLDKYGKQIWQAVLDKTLDVGPYAKLLENAMKQGPAQVAVVHQTLMKTDPKYKALVEGQQ